MKTCSKCGDEKPLDAFSNRKASLDGKAHNCKECVKDYKKEYREKNPNKFVRTSVRFYDLPEGMRKCALCEEVKETALFYVDNSRASGTSTQCKECLNARLKEHRKTSGPERLNARRTWSEANRDRLREQERLYREANRDRKRVTQNRRRARQSSLPDDLTLEQTEELLELFDGKCAICEADAEHLDHFIPIASGHGGTTLKNMVPMCARCNISKRATNPFVWARQLPEYERERFNRLVEHLSELNGIVAVADYEAHVNQCFK